MYLGRYIWLSPELSTKITGQLDKFSFLVESFDSVCRFCKVQLIFVGTPQMYLSSAGFPSTWGLCKNRPRTKYVQQKVYYDILVTLSMLFVHIFYITDNVTMLLKLVW